MASDMNKRLSLLQTRDMLGLASYLNGELMSDYINGPGDLEPGVYTVRCDVRAENGYLVARQGDTFRVVRLVQKAMLLDSDQRLVPMKWWGAIVQALAL